MREMSRSGGARGGASDAAARPDVRGGHNGARPKDVVPKSTSNARAPDTSLPSMTSNSGSTSSLNNLERSNLGAAEITPVEIKETLVNVNGESVSAVHPNFMTEEARRTTFESWLESNSINKEVLIKAGFIYAGFNDNVKCFFCGGGLRNWEATDDPWVEHAKWYIDCAFVRAVKGDAFVKHVAAKYPRPVPTRPGTTLQHQNGSGQSARAPPKPRGGYSYSMETIRNLMGSEQAQRVLEMGYGRGVLQRALENQFRENGEDFRSLDSLLEGVLSADGELQEERRQTKSMLRENADRAPEGERAALRQMNQDDSSSETSEEEQEPQKLSRAQKKKKAKKARKLAEQMMSGQLKEKLEKIKEIKESGGELSKEQIQDLNNLKDESKRMKDARTCKICLDQEVAIVFLPCGHLVCCASCAPSLRDCPICRSLVRGTVRTWLS